MAYLKTPPYDAKAVANYFLELAERQGKKLDAMKIQKLVYLAHGWHLAITGKPLITERVEAWLYGPVVRSLYSAFRDAGSGPITRPACDPDFVSGRVVLTVPRIDDSADPETRQILDEVWRVYGDFSAIQLSNLTHQPDTPWAKIWNASEDKNGLIIDDDLIKQYFVNQARTHEPA